MRLALRKGVGGVLGPFRTCAASGLGWTVSGWGSWVGVLEAGVAAAGGVSRAARWQWRSAEWHYPDRVARVRLAGADVAVAVGMAVGVAAAGVEAADVVAADVVAAVGVSSAGTAAAGVALASTMQCSSCSVAAAAVWHSGSSVASAARWHRRGSISMAVR